MFSSAVRCCWGRERVYSLPFTVYRLRFAVRRLKFAVWVILKKTKWILQEAYADKKYSQLNLHHSHFVRHSLWRRRIKPPLITLTLDLPPIPSDSRREGTAASLSAEALAKADCPWALSIWKRMNVLLPPILSRKLPSEYPQTPIPTGLPPTNSIFSSHHKIESLKKRVESIRCP